MTTKLTLTIDDAVISKAKKYASKKGKSLSGIVQNYLSSLTSREEETDQLSPRVRRLMGVISIPENVDYKKELTRQLSKKYKR
ncbi:MAG: DUF6364 family protein [Bacteroidota bacterium]